jgi:hypothetical protein
MIFDMFGSVFWRWIIPGGIFIDLPVHLDMVVAGHSFPRASGVFVAFFEVSAVYRVGREVLVAFDDFTTIAFGQHGAAPDCFGHGIASFKSSRDYADLQSSCKSELLQSSLKPSARLGAFRRKSAGKFFPPNFAEIAECRRKKQKTFPGLRHRVARRAPGQAEFFSNFD